MCNCSCFGFLEDILASLQKASSRLRFAEGRVWKCSNGGPWVCKWSVWSREWLGGSLTSFHCHSGPVAHWDLTWDNYESMRNYTDDYQVGTNLPAVFVGWGWERENRGEWCHGLGLRLWARTDGEPHCPHQWAEWWGPLPGHHRAPSARLTYPRDK